MVRPPPSLSARARRERHTHTYTHTQCEHTHCARHRARPGAPTARALCAHTKYPLADDQHQGRRQAPVLATRQQDEPAERPNRRCARAPRGGHRGPRQRGAVLLLPSGVPRRAVPGRTRRRQSSPTATFAPRSLSPTSTRRTRNRPRRARSASRSRRARRASRSRRARRASRSRRARARRRRPSGGGRRSSTTRRCPAS